VDVRHEGEETESQRLTRNVNELLSELRVAQAGVQILFGFLLSVVFTQTFRDASGFEKSLHLVAVLLALVSTALLTAPAAWHRLLFRENRREEILRDGNPMVIAGLVALAGALTVTVSLIAKVVFGPVAMVVMVVTVTVMFGVLWFVIPARLRR
jgi:cation transport ATPase